MLFSRYIRTTLLILLYFIVSGEIRVATNHFSHVFVHCYGHLVTWVNFYNVVQHYFAHTRNTSIQSRVAIIIDMDRFSPARWKPSCKKIKKNKTKKEITLRSSVRAVLLPLCSGTITHVQSVFRISTILIFPHIVAFSERAWVLLSLSYFIMFGTFVVEVSGIVQLLMKYS